MTDTGTIFNIAFRAIKANKMRSILTSLGIIIGVAAVIIMLAIGKGAQKSIQDDMKTMGTNLIMIRSGTTTSGGARGGFGSQPTMKGADGDAIQEKISKIRLAAPVLNDTGQIVYGNANWSTSITGTDNRYFDIRDWDLAYGTGFTDRDIKTATKRAILGQTVVTELFGDMNPIGKTVRIKGIPFEVIGVLKKLGQSGNGMDQDDIIFIPITTAQRKVTGVAFPDMVRMVMLQAVDAESTYTAQPEIRELLRQRHNLGQNKDDDFTIMNFTQMMEMVESTTKVMTLFLGAIASISLFVGGIGIMNIMLVSVTERTREIGIRMAIGAKAWDIRLQFLTEALVLSLIGGLIGILIGFLGIALVRSFSNFVPVVDLIYVVLPFSFSGLVGLFFGFYPAYKASLLNPINALRFE